MLQAILPMLLLDEIDDLTLRSNEGKDVETPMKRLSDLESVKKALQRDALSITNARALFNEDIDFG